MPRLRGSRALFAASSGSDSGSDWEEDVQQMEAVILAISRETNDESRREQMRTLFVTELAHTSVGDAPPHFAQVFGSALEKVGGAVQSEARERAEAEQATAPQELDAGAENEEYVPRQKTAEELQLWALIDMMVQSKMLVRKATVAPENK